MFHASVHLWNANFISHQVADEANLQNGKFALQMLVLNPKICYILVLVYQDLLNQWSIYIILYYIIHIQEIYNGTVQQLYFYLAFL